MQQLVDAVKPEGLAGDYLVEFLPDDRPHGVADPHIGRARVYVAGDPPAGAVYMRRRATKLRTGAEACVFVLAHELRHLWQSETGLRMRNEPKERDADAYAARALRRYRRGPALLAHMPTTRAGVA